MLPFIGHGGAYQVCLAAPGHTFQTGGDEGGCLNYPEAATMFLDNSAYTIGDTVNFSGEMLDPGAQVRVNLLSSIGTFMFPWQQTGFRHVTADSHGHIAGSSRPIRFRLATGGSRCSASPAARSLPSGTHRRLDTPASLAAANPHPTSTVPVTVGPAFSVRSKLRVSAKVQVKGTKILRVQAKLPPSTTVQPMIAVGGFDRPDTGFAFRAIYVDGMKLIRLPDLTADSHGTLKHDLDLRFNPLIAGQYLLWLVRGDDEVITSTPFTVTAGMARNSRRRSLAGRPSPDFSLPIHAAITRTALSPLGIPAAVLDQIEGSFIMGLGNLGSDIHQLTSFRHFDNAATPGAVCQLANQAWNEFTTQIRLSLGSNLLAGARSAFGALSHSAQDFYTHSNWLELGQRNVAPLFPLCTGVGLPGGLQTGYFKLDSSASSDVDPGPLISGCPVTPGLTNNAWAPPVPFMYCHVQLNKDEPRRHGLDLLPGGNGTNYHRAAVDLATTATAALYQNVRTFINTSITPANSDLKGSCMSDAMFGLLPVTGDELRYCRDVSGNWTTPGTASGHFKAPWVVTSSNRDTIDGFIASSICGNMPFHADAAPTMGSPDQTWAGTFSSCLVDVDTGMDLPGPCHGTRQFPLTVSYVGLGRMLAVMTDVLFEEDEDAMTCTEVSRTPEPLNLTRAP